MEFHPTNDDGLKERFIQLTRDVAHLLFDLMQTNQTHSICLSDFSEMLSQQNIFDDENDANGWLTTTQTDAMRRRKRRGKMVARVVGIVSTFLDTYFEIVYLSDVNDFVIRLRESQLFAHDTVGPSTNTGWSECQAIQFLNRIEQQLFDQKASDELSAAMGNANTEDEVQCPFEQFDEGEDDE